MIPATQQGKPIFLDGNVPVAWLKASLVASGLKMKATNKGIVIVLAAKGRK